MKVEKLINLLQELEEKSEIQCDSTLEVYNKDKQWVGWIDLLNGKFHKAANLAAEINESVE